MGKHHRSGLMKNSILILSGVVLVIMLALFINYVIIHRWYQAESVRTRQDFFEQITEQIKNEEISIVNLTDTVLSNQVVLDYLNADVLSGRWNKLSEVRQFASSLMKLNDSIEAVCIRNCEGEVIAMQGTKYAPVPDGDFEDALQRFSNSVRIDGESEPYFYALIPVYQKTETKSYEKAGDVAVLFNTAWITENLKLAAAAFSWEDSCLIVFDRNGEILAQAGNGEVYAGLGEEKGMLSFEEEFPESGWKICYLTRKASYMEYTDRVQTVNLITYVFVIFALIWMCVLMYRKVVLSIRRQMEFVVNYTKDTTKRLEVWDTTEFGELENELNEMLDEIEELNREVLKEREEKFRLEYEKKQTEMVAYKNQVNPHFMFNTLECLRGMALYRGEREIARLTEAMARMFQYNVKGNEIVTVKEMLQSIRDYAVIINYRFMGRIRVEIEAEEKALACRLPKMIVHPFVENAVRHGLEPKVGTGTAKLSLSCRGERLEIIISDDGVGMDEAELSRQKEKIEEAQKADGQPVSGKEIGIANVARRIFLFYGKSCTLEIDSGQNRGTKVTVELPQKLPEG